MEGRRDSFGLVSLSKTKSSDSQSSGIKYRPSFGQNWFKKLSSKVSGVDPETGLPLKRKGSTASTISTGTQDLELDTNEFRKASKIRSNSESRRTSDFQPLHRQARSSSMSSVQQGLKSQSRLPNPGSKGNMVDVAPGFKKLSASSESHLNGSLAEPNPSTEPVKATLSDLKRLKVNTRSVGFALSTFLNNPPQRIPPLNPSKDNLEFLENGELLVHRHVKHSIIGEPPYLRRDHAEVAKLAQAKARQNAERLRNSMTLGSFASIFTAGKLNSDSMEDTEPSNFSLAQNDVDLTSTLPKSTHLSEFVSTEKSNSNIPTHISLGNSSASSEPNLRINEDGWEQFNPRQTSAVPPPDQIYIRCCHLREIMPIKNILKQLKGQLAPLPQVHVANIRPTLVEIQAFSDFLTVVPVASLTLDNHIMTDEMIRLILVGISRSRDIARLTLTNTKLSILGWRYLCSFLANSRKSLAALNLTCTDPTSVPHRVNSFTRSNMDWALFSEALTAMGSLEELNLGGTEISIDDLKLLLDGGFKDGKILSLSNNKLDHNDVRLVAEWAQRSDSKLMGIDLSGNDLSREEDLDLVQTLLHNPRIMELSLRNTKLSRKHASYIVSAFAPKDTADSSLRKLDLSCNPGLFPHIVDRLAHTLRRIPYLSRLQLENCNLDSDTIVTLCEALSHCHRLVYLSFAGNGTLSEIAATALCVTVHLSQSICTVEADFSDSCAAIRHQLAKYCLLNLEKNAGTKEAEPEPDENADIASFYDDLKSVTHACFDYKAEGTSIDALIERIEELRTRIKLRMQSLIILRRQGPLSVSAREATLRLFFYSTNLDRLKRQVTGTEPAEPQYSEEKVNKMDESEDRPSLERQASLMSLKKLEREEALSHREYADQFMNLEDDKILDAVANLKVEDLERIMG